MFVDAVVYLWSHLFDSDKTFYNIHNIGALWIIFYNSGCKVTNIVLFEKVQIPRSNSIDRAKK